MRPVLLALLLIFAPASLGAQTLTTRDIVTLNRSGLGEEVLMALIEVHRSVFPVDRRHAQDAEGRRCFPEGYCRNGEERPRLSAGRTRTRAGAHRSADRCPRRHRRSSSSTTRVRSLEAREVAVPVAFPVYVPVQIHRPRPVRPVDDCVFWGFGGKLRPDAWKPVETHHKPFFLVKGPQKK